MHHFEALRGVAIVGFCLAASLIFIASPKAYCNPVVSPQQGLVQEISGDTGSPALLQKAEAGDKKAQYRLAIAYQEGRGVEKNYFEAAKWYRRSADQGFAAAQSALGFYYRHGLGLPRDAIEAVHWYRVAAEQDWPSAENNLGVAYTDGIGVARDYRLAFEWFSRAAKHGVSTAYHGLGTLYLTGNGTRQDYAKAVAFGNLVWPTLAV